MLLHAARFPARVDCVGTLFLLRDQDRSRWDRAMIAEGMRALDRPSAGNAITSFHLEAGIAARHAAAATWASTTGARLLRSTTICWRSPARCSGHEPRHRRVPDRWAAGGTAALEGIDNLEVLDRYPLLPAIQAELWREAGEVDRAVQCYRVALDLARSWPEECWLTARLSLLV